MSDRQARRRRKHIRLVNEVLPIIREAGLVGINIKELAGRLSRPLGSMTSQAIGNHLAILRRRVPFAIERYFHSINGYSETYYRWIGDEQVETVLNSVYGYIGNEEVETDA